MSNDPVQLSTYLGSLSSTTIYKRTLVLASIYERTRLSTACQHKDRYRARVNLLNYATLITRSRFYAGDNERPIFTMGSFCLEMSSWMFENMELQRQRDIF